jgi:hypothetical protein
MAAKPASGVARGGKGELEREILPRVGVVLNLSAFLQLVQGACNRIPQVLASTVDPVDQSVSNIRRS